MKKKLVTFFRDFVYSAIGLVAMNAVLSLLVYPMIERTAGAAAQGSILFYTSVAGLLASAFGGAANYGRLKIFSEEHHTANGEYNRFLLTSFLCAALTVVLAVLIKKDSGFLGGLGVFLLSVTMILRYYADVCFRMNLQYGRYCLYYLSVTAGYLLGLLVYKLSGASWLVIFITGECFGILFSLIFGTVLRKPYLDRTPDSKKHYKTLYSLTGAYLLSDFVGTSDRLLLPVLVPQGDELNAIYYYASLVGKITSLLSSPLNGVLAGYLSRAEGKVSRKRFLQIVGILVLAFSVITAAAYFGSHLFVWLFYRSYYEAVRPLFLLANAGQVLAFICNTLMVIVLRYTHTRNQIITSAVYVAAYFALTIPLTLRFGILGMAIGVLSVNVLKFLLFTVLGLISVGKNQKAPSEENNEET